MKLIKLENHTFTTAFFYTNYSDISIEFINVNSVLIWNNTYLKSFACQNQLVLSDEQISK